MQSDCPVLHTTRDRQGRRFPCASSIPAHHQQDVIHASLDRVRVIGGDVHECILCLEYYHSMMLLDTLCARCHNQVRSPFSLVHALTDILIPTVHKTANIAANHADPDKIKSELHDIIDGITQTEEMLRSLTSPCFVMRVSKSGKCFHFPTMDSRRSCLCRRHWF